MGNKNNNPEVIELTDTEFSDLIDRIKTNTSTQSDQKTIITILQTYNWIYKRLQTAQLGIRRLRSLFGFKNEKRSSLKSKDNRNSGTENNSHASAIDFSSQSSDKDSSEKKT